jgi:hypothetical protein
VADQHNLSGMIPPGGDLGFVAPGTLLPPLDDVVRTGPLHRPLGPIRSGDGWFIVYLEERQPEPRRRSADAAATHRRWCARTSGGLRDAGLADQPRRAPGRHGACGVTASERFWLQPATGDSMPAATPPSPEERAQVLAATARALHTLGEAYTTSSTALGRDPPWMISTIESWLQSQTTERAALAEARDGAADDPEVQRKLKDRLTTTCSTCTTGQVVARISVRSTRPARLRQHKVGLAQPEPARIDGDASDSTQPAAGLRSPDSRRRRHGRHRPRARGGRGSRPTRRCGRGSGR